MLDFFRWHLEDGPVAGQNNGTGQIERFRPEGKKREAPTWTETREITRVMPTTRLAPDKFRGIWVFVFFGSVKLSGLLLFRMSLQCKMAEG